MPYLVLAAFAASFIVLYRLGRIGPIRRPSAGLPKAVPDFAATEEVRTAVHEAGHAVVASRATMVNHICDSRVHDMGGEVEYSILCAKGQAETSMVIKLGGIAAELMVYGTFRAKQCEKDLVGARALIEETDPLRLDPWDGAPVTFLKKAYANPLTEKEEQVLLRAYCMARRMVEREQRVHGILVGHFLTAGTLTESHFKRFFGSRAFLRVRGISGRLFL